MFFLMVFYAFTYRRGEFLFLLPILLISTLGVVLQIGDERQSNKIEAIKNYLHAYCTFKCECSKIHNSNVKLEKGLLRMLQKEQFLWE
jgi:hypothetical protein